jgi:uncharacterized protein
MGNPIIWFEILGPQPETAAKFYSELFGWHTQTVEGGYVLIDTHAGSGMNGGIGNPPEGGKPGSIFYVGDPDIQALLDKAIGMGAKTEMPITTIPDMVTYGSFTDPWGNVVGLMKHDATGSMVSAGTNPPVDWIELSSTEPQLAWDFYRELFGWTIEGDMSGEDGRIHGSIDTGASEGARGGIGNARSGEPGLDAYARVDDMATFLARAQTLGATVVMPAMKVDEHTEIAMFTDPQGTVFGLYADSH